MILGPTLLLRSGAILGTNGKAAFIWKLHSHWLIGLPHIPNPVLIQVRDHEHNDTSCQFCTRLLRMRLAVLCFILAWYWVSLLISIRITYWHCHQALALVAVKHLENLWAEGSFGSTRNSYQTIIKWIMIELCVDFIRQTMRVLSKIVELTLCCRI